MIRVIPRFLQKSGAKLPSDLEKTVPAVQAKEPPVQLSLFEDQPSFARGHSDGSMAPRAESMDGAGLGNGLHDSSMRGIPEAISFWSPLSLFGATIHWKLWLQLLICVFHPFPYLDEATRGAFSNKVHIDLN